MWQPAHPHSQSEEIFGFAITYSFFFHQGVLVDVVRATQSPEQHQPEHEYL
jgi:hypothetical protein